MLTNLACQFLDLEGLLPLAKKPISHISGFSENNFESQIPLAEFLFSLDIWSTSDVNDPFVLKEVKNFSYNPDLKKYLEIGKNKQLIRDFIGIKEKSPNKLIFSTLVGHSPKIYLAMYLFFIRWLNNQMNKRVRLIIFLEDWFSCFFLKKTINESSLLKYENFIKMFGVAKKIICSRNNPIKKIVYATFVSNYLQKISMGDFFSVLPYSKRNLSFINLADLLHFVWNIYVFFLNPGIYLTSINSKREFIVFRKALGEKLSVIFFPTAPENIENGNESFYSRYLNSPGDIAIWREIKKWLSDHELSTPATNWTYD